MFLTSIRFHCLDCSGIVRAWRLGHRSSRYILGGENITVKKLLEMIAAENNVKPPSYQLPVWVQLMFGYLGFVPLEKVIPANMFMWFSSRKAERELGYTSRPAQECIHDR